MKKYKKIGMTFIILSVVIIMVGIIFAILIKNKKTMEENIGIIKKTYTNFSVAVGDNYDIRAELSDKLNQFNNENYPNEHATYSDLLIKYNENMTSINISIDTLEDKCKIDYDDKQTNIFCDNYQQLYEVINNAYVENLNNYNNKITRYNETSEEDYDVFPLINKDYIDFDKNGIFSGKTNE